MIPTEYNAAFPRLTASVSLYDESTNHLNEEFSSEISSRHERIGGASKALSCSRE